MPKSVKVLANSKSELVESPFIAQHRAGRKTFSLLFTRWMDINRWSHPVITALSESSLAGARWLHSSQISAIRHNGLENPGPRPFIAIAVLNQCLYDYKMHKKPIPGTKNSNDYQEPFIITEDGLPPSTGWWVEVFAGLRVPKDIELYQAFFTPDQAAALTGNWGALARKLIRNQDMDLITDMDRILRDSYPVKEPERLKRMREVLQNKYTWSPEELIEELPAIVSFTGNLEGPSTEEELLELLQ